MSNSNSPAFPHDCSGVPGSPGGLTKLEYAAIRICAANQGLFRLTVEAGTRDAIERAKALLADLDKET